MIKVFIFVLLTFPMLTANAAITVSADFEGGSVEVLELDTAKQFIKIAPADHPGKGFRCWWYFRVDGLAKNSTLTLDVGVAPWATPDRAHISDDGEKTWRHTVLGKRDGRRIRYEIAVTTRTVHLAWGPPFTPADSQELVSSVAAKYQTASAFNLADTRENRPTPALRITAPGAAENRRVIWLQARQHAWESGASWVAKGLVEFLVSDDSRAKKLRSQNVIFMVPVMDIDNTARGAGGKSQQPQDHNRDWSEKPHWHAVAAAQKYISEADRAGKFALFVDLHNPGANDRMPYFYITPRDLLSEPGSKNLDQFLAAAKAEITGPLRFPGRATESGPKYDPENWMKISKNWVIANTADGVVAATLETSWNTPSSTTENYQIVGDQLGRAMARMGFLRD